VIFAYGMHMHIKLMNTFGNNVYVLLSIMTFSLIFAYFDVQRRRR